MLTIKPKYNYQKALRKICIAFGTSLCLLPIIEAANINHIKDKTIAIAQEASVCQPSGGSQFVSAETRNYLVYICGGDNPNTYIGMAKNGGNSISLPLQSYNRDRFVAVNRDTRYTLTRTELIVTQKGRVIVRESAKWKW